MRDGMGRNWADGGDRQFLGLSPLNQNGWQVCNTFNDVGMLIHLEYIVYSKYVVLRKKIKIMKDQNMVKLYTSKFVVQ